MDVKQAKNLWSGEVIPNDAKFALEAMYFKYPTMTQEEANRFLDHYLMESVR